VSIPEPEDICPETSDGYHCGHWREGGKCCACGLAGALPGGDDEGYFPDGDPRDAEYIGGCRLGLEE